MCMCMQSKCTMMHSHHYLIVNSENEDDDSLNDVYFSLKFFELLIFCNELNVHRLTNSSEIIIVTHTKL